MSPYPEAKAILESDALMERLASVEHERWAHWQRYVHEQCTRAEDGSLVIPAELAQRWAVQIATPYARLTEVEKESDREQVRRYLPILVEAVTAVEGTDRSI
jgi:hypothetical protein